MPVASHENPQQHAKRLHPSRCISLRLGMHHDQFTRRGWVFPVQVPRRWWWLLWTRLEDRKLVSLDAKHQDKGEVGSWKHVKRTESDLTVSMFRISPSRAGSSIPARKLPRTPQEMRGGVWSPADLNINTMACIFGGLHRCSAQSTFHSKWFIDGGP